MPIQFFQSSNKNLSGPLIASLHKLIERNIPLLNNNSALTIPDFIIKEGYPAGGIDICQLYELCTQAFVTDATGKSLTQFQLHISYEDVKAGNVLGACASTMGNLVNLINDVLKNPNWHTETFSACSIPENLDWHLSGLSGGAGGSYSLTGEACGNFTTAAQALQVSCENEQAFWVQDNMGLIVILSIVAFVALCITMSCTISAVRTCRSERSARIEELEPEALYVALGGGDAEESKVEKEAGEEKAHLVYDDECEISPVEKTESSLSRNSL
jgi:hypothetical protein